LQDFWVLQDVADNPVQGETRLVWLNAIVFLGYFGHFVPDGFIAHLDVCKTQSH